MSVFGCCTGCIWVSAAADFGPEGVFERLVLVLMMCGCTHGKDRFDQVQPHLIISVDAVVYVPVNGARRTLVDSAH